MMAFWPEHQGQSPLYSKFGTVPGRNFTHNYHDRHQATHYPLYCGEQQDQGRESSYWTVPGSRTGGVLQDYTNWTDPEQSAPIPSHVPFILDHHSQQRQDLGEYQPHEARGREWALAQRAAREYERGFLREGWQRRWEPCSPVRYNREVSAKRSDSSYRELEAWAARYSHSLPRRRRIEAELRGTSQGLLESSRAPERDSRGGIDPQAAALQQVRQPANIRESGVWDREGRQHNLPYYPPQALAPDTSHMLDTKGKAGYQRRMLSQPPGYIAPPPYNSPHKSSPVMRNSDISWEQESARQTYWSQPTLRQQDVSVDLQEKRKGEKEDFTKPHGNKTCAELDGLEHRGAGRDVSEAGSPIGFRSTPIQSESMLSLQSPQTLQTVQNTKINDHTSSKVSKIIEGRKFRLNKKTGGMTIFCLVSRIAGTTETPSLPLCTSQTNIQNTVLEEVSKGHRDIGDIYQRPKLADEVDFRAPAVTEQSNTSVARDPKAKQEATPTCIESEMLGDNLSNKAEVGISTEKANANNTNSTFARQEAQSAQPVSVKYPLWREPSFTSRAETESPSTSLKANSEEGQSDGQHNQEEPATAHPINVSVGSLDMQKDTQSMDSKGLLVIDTTCVVVKMELIPSPKKEHVHYLGSTPQSEDSPFDIQSSTSPETINQLNQDVISNAETNPLQINDRPETKLDSDLGEKKAPMGGDYISPPPLSSLQAIFEKETLEERAERILGIPLHDCVTGQYAPLLDSCVAKWDEEVESLPITNNIHGSTQQLSEDTAEEEQTNVVGQTEDAVHLKEGNDTEDQEKKGSEGFAGAQEQVSNMPGGQDTDYQEAEMAEDNLLESTCKKGTTEQSQKETQPTENDMSSHDTSQCFKDLPNSSVLSLSNLTALSFISRSNTEERLETSENLAPHPETSSPLCSPSQQLPSPLPPGSIETSPCSTPHTHHSLSPPPPPLHLIDRTAEAVSGTEDEDEESETSQQINSDISEAFDHLEDQEVVSQQLLDGEHPDSAACVEESIVTNEQQPTETDPTELLEQTLEKSKENAVDGNVLQHQPECVQTEDVAAVIENCMTEKQQQHEASEDPADLLEATISQENVTETEVDVKILPQQYMNNNQEENDCIVKEIYMTEEQTQKEASEQPGFLVQTSEISKENGTDSQVEDNTLQQQLYYSKEEDAPHVKDMTEDQSQVDADEDPADLLEATISQENVTENQIQEEVEILPQQYDMNNSQEENDCIVQLIYMAEEQTQKEASEQPGFLVQTSEIFKENGTDSQVEDNILQQQLYYSKEEDAPHVKDMREDQSQVDAIENPADLLEATTTQENVTENQTQEEFKILPQQYMNNSQEENACIVQEIYITASHVKDMTEDQSQVDADEDPADLLEQTISLENAADIQTQMEMQDNEPSDFPSSSPSDLDREVGQSPSQLPSPTNASHKPDTEPDSPLKMDSSALNPVTADAGIPEIVPLPLQLDSCEESLQLSTSSASESSALNLGPSASTPNLEGAEGFSHDLPHKEDPQYPKSLWDAVNRIRKHTAPDSENEEEEVSEQWDPESIGDDLGCPGAPLDVKSERTVFDEAGQHKVSSEGVENVEQGPCHEEPSGHAEGDALSCSSTSSSGDTITTAEEAEAEETPHDTMTESKTETDEEFPVAEEEESRSAEVKDESAAKEGGEGEQDVECTVEVEDKTVEATEVIETEQKENEEGGYTP